VRILITGIAGFAGSSLALALQERGFTGSGIGNSRATVQGRP